MNEPVLILHSSQVKQRARTQLFSASHRGSAESRLGMVPHYIGKSQREAPDMRTVMLACQAQQVLRAHGALLDQPRQQGGLSCLVPVAKACTGDSARVSANNVLARRRLLRYDHALTR